MEDRERVPWRLCDDVSLSEMAQLFAITRNFLPPAQEDGQKVIHGRQDGNRISELHYPNPSTAKADFPLCNQNHQNLNLIVVSRFVLWLWHSRKTWLDGLIQTINPSQETIYQTSLKPNLHITHLFFKRVICHNPLQTRGLPPVKFFWSLQWIFSWVPVLNLYQNYCTEVVLRGVDHKATRFTQTTDKSSDTKNFRLLIDTVWMESPKLLQRWKSLCQFISHLVFVIRKH